jgi:hypothetical protein
LDVPPAFFTVEPGFAFSAAEPARTDRRTNGQTDVFAFFLFFFEFFSPSLKLTKMKKQNKN